MPDVMAGTYEQFFYGVQNTSFEMQYVFDLVNNVVRVDPFELYRLAAMGAVISGDGLVAVFAGSH